MICVTIARTRHRMMIAEYEAASQRGIALAELRLDYLRRAPNLGRLLAEKGCPVIITCRRRQDGGRFNGSEEERQTVLRAAVASGVDYVDLESDIAKRIPRFGKTKRIVSYHNFKTTPQNLAEIHQEMLGMDPDIVKMATFAERPGDNLRMLQLVRTSPVPMVGFCMGDLGTASRILGPKFGAPFTYAAFNQERLVAPGQIPYSQLRDEYHYDRINVDSDVYAVIGDPVEQSLSPLIHNLAFRKFGMNCIYLPVRVPRGRLAEFLKLAPGLGIKGMSITIPHKEEAMKCIAQADGAARTIGALNTLVPCTDGWEGHNTDYRAAMESIEHAMGGEQGEASPLSSKQVLLIGAGGAARAIGHGLVRRGALVTIANRNQKRAEELAKELGARFVNWGLRMSTFCDILVNCTPIGMFPNVNEAPLPGNSLREGMLVFDTIYHPENTVLIKEARARGCRVITGVDMFVRQAALQFQIFTGHEAPEADMRDACRRRLSPVKTNTE